jgi:putative endonuclease
MGYFVYILRCADKTLYTGIALDVKKRVSEHNGKSDGKRNVGAKYTSTRRPVRLVYSKACVSRSKALKREYAIKKLSRAEKLKLIKKSKAK